MSQEEQRDLRLINEWLGGDEAAATELHDRYLRRVLHLVEKNTSKKFGSKFDAEDVAQSVFRSLFRGVRDGRLTASSPDGIWVLLRNIVVWKVRKRVRFYNTKKRDIQRETTGAEILAKLARPSDAEAVELAEVLDKVHRSLRVPEQQTLELLLEGKDPNEIAEILSVTTQSVQRYQKKIHLKLQTLLDQLEN